MHSPAGACAACRRRDALPARTPLEPELGALHDPAVLIEGRTIRSETSDLRAGLTTHRVLLPVATARGYASRRGARPRRRGAARAAAGEPAAPASVGAVPDGDRADRGVAPSGTPNSARKPAPASRRDAEEAGAEPLVDRGLQDQQRGHRRCRCASRAPASGSRRGRSSPCRARRSGRGTPPCSTAARSRPGGAHAAQPAVGPPPGRRGGRRPEPRHVVRGVQHQERPALAEPGARRSHRVATASGPRPRGSTGGRRSCGPSGGGGRRPGTPWGRSWLTTSSAMWRDLAPVGRSAGERRLLPAAVRHRRARVHGVVPRAGRRARARGRAGRLRQPRRLVARRRSAAGPRVLTGSHLDSVLDGGAYDGPLGVVSALAAVDVLRTAGVAPAPARRDRRLRRGGGLAVRRWPAWVPAGHRRHRLGRTRAR